MCSAQQALETARSAGEDAAVAAALVAVARHRFRLGQEGQACALAQEALALARPGSAARADALLMLGMCASEADALAECESCYRRAAALARTLGDPLLLFRSLHNLGSGGYTFLLEQERGLAFPWSPPTCARPILPSSRSPPPCWPTWPGCRRRST